MYEYQLMNNHYIVTIGENKFLIDTGAPSFRINDEVREVVIDGHSHSLRPKLPQMDDEAVKAAIQEAIAATGASSMKDMGKVMGILRGKYAGQMDFGKASGLIKSLLG